MAWNKKNTLVLEIPRVNRPEPSIVVAEAPGSLQAYVGVAESLGFSNGALTRRRLLNFCQREEIPTYDYQRVCRYMDSLVPLPSGHNWIENGQTGWKWFTLRECDLTIGDNLDWDSSGGFDTRDQYSKPVPIDALRQAKLISDAFPSVKLLVADKFIRQSRSATRGLSGDPFMAAWINDMDPIVFAVWDEPGF